MRENNFSYLFLALLVFLIGIPVAYDLNLMTIPVLRLIGISSLLAIGIWSLLGAGRLFAAGMILVVIGILLNVVFSLTGNALVQIASLIALFAFLLLATINALRLVAVGNEINSNRIVGAVCIYLLFGVMWSIAYALLEFSEPGSFKGMSELALSTWNSDWIYYSFVTLTTLGYGDITPVSQTARVLTYSEAITGQFYLAVLVAGLVSAYISAKRDKTGQ